MSIPRSHLSRACTFISLLVVVHVLVPLARAWVLDGAPPWPDGTVTLHLKLGNGTTYSDGKSPNATALEALNEWNPYIQRVQLAGQDDGSGQGTNNNGVSEVFFANNVYGQSFDTGVLAITVVQASATTRTEADVVVNNAMTWDAYHGAIGNSYDLRRVLAHEFGHVLGLDHPDQHGQGFAALMDSTISDSIETPQADDIEGVCTLYGYRLDPSAPAPTIDWNLDASLSAYVGDSIDLSISTMSFAPTYQWYKDGVAIKGAYGPGYTITSASSSDAGSYTCVVTTAGGSITSRACRVSVSPVPLPDIIGQPKDVSVYTSLSTIFEVNALGPHLTYQWMKDGKVLPGATLSSLSLNNVQPSDAGKYTVTVTNSAGTVTSDAAQLVVTPPPLPKIIDDPKSTIVLQGSPLGLSVNAQSPVALTYQWYKDGVAIPNATSSIFYVSSAAASNAGTYTVTVTNLTGSATSAPASVTLGPAAAPPSIALWNQAITLGSPFSYSYSYNPAQNPADSTYTFQWYHNGIPISGATSYSLAIQSATYADAGEYFLVISGQNGESVSQSGYVTIQPPSTATSGTWIATTCFGGISYFLFASTPRIERYDIANASWLTPIPLAQKASCLAVNADGIFIDDTNHVYHMNLDGSAGADWGPQLDGAIFGLSADTNLLAVDFHASGVVHVSGMDTKLGSVAWSIASAPFASDHILYVDHTRSIYSFDLAGTASPIVREVPQSNGQNGLYMSIQPAGLGASSWIAPSPDGTAVISDDGCVYDSSTLAIKGHLSPLGESIAFLQNGTIAVLASDYIHFFDSSYHEVGCSTNGGSYAAIANSGDQLVAFSVSSDATGHPTATVISPTATSARPTAPIVDPTGLAVRADASVVDNAGIVYICDRLRRNLFRWSTSQHAFLSPAIPLQGSPIAMSYSSTNNRIYLAYADERITQIQLDLNGAKEVPFAYCGSPAQSLCMIDDKVCADEYNQLELFDTSGNFLSWINWQRGPGPEWDSATQRLYYVNTTFAPSAVCYMPVSASGKFGIYNFLDGVPLSAAAAPILVSPDGADAAFGSGIVSSVTGAGPLGTTDYPFGSGAWVGTNFYSFINTIDGIAISRWNGTTKTTDESTTIWGQGVNLLTLPQNRLLLLSSEGGALHYIVLDANLNQLSNDGPAATDRMIGLSSRASVGTGDNIMVSGFVIQGSTPKQVVVRAIGPSLAQSNIANPMADPQVTIYDSNSQPIAGNDNFGSVANLSDLKAAMSRLGLSALPDGSRDAAMLVTLKPGLYTAQVSGVNNGTGVGLLEIYDADEAPGTCRMTCLSSRAQVGTGDNILVSGFIISGAAGKTLLIRADGPSLSQYGVSGVLANPQIKLFQNTTQIASNDDWCSDPTQVAAIEAAAKKTGLFALPEGSKDSAILIHLKPGLYTAQVSGSDGGTGVAMLEVYEVPQ